MITLRTMTPGDIPAGLSLCRAAGWNQRASDWQLFLEMSPQGCRVAIDDDGKVVGTVTMVQYQDHFSWIGMVLVDPVKRRQGIGIQLLKESLRILSSEQTIKLDATAAGREVYQKLNFVDEYPVRRMLWNGSTAKLLPSPARHIEAGDLPKLLEIDAEVFGAGRNKVLEWMWRGAPSYALLIEDNNQIKGYALGRSGHNYMHIGPVVAEDMRHAVHLVTASLKNCGEQPVILDTLLHTPKWLTWLSSIGFVEQRSFVRMYRGTNAWPGIPKKQFAILGPEFG